VEETAKKYFYWEVNGNSETKTGRVILLLNSIQGRAQEFLKVFTIILGSLALIGKVFYPDIHAISEMKLLLAVGIIAFLVGTFLSMYVLFGCFRHVSVWKYFFSVENEPKTDECWAEEFSAQLKRSEDSINRGHSLFFFGASALIVCAIGASWSVDRVCDVSVLNLTCEILEGKKDTKPVAAPAI
jgi:hypothetical protein